MMSRSLSSTWRVLSVLLALSTTPVHMGWAGEPSALEHEYVILKNLPKPDTAKYRYLRDIAGDISGERLVMNGAEIWSMDKKRVDMLEHAASEQGIALEFLRPNFSEILAPHPETGPTAQPMSQAASAMLAEIKSDVAVTSAVPIDLKSPVMLEYAMARGMKPMINMRPVEPSVTSNISLVLPDGQRITISRKHVETTRLGCVWHGQIAGSSMPASFMWWPDGRVTGSFTHNNHIYQIRNVGGRDHVLVETDPAMLPPEHETADAIPILRQRAEGQGATILIDEMARTGEAVAALDGKRRHNSRDAAEGSSSAQVSPSVPALASAPSTRSAAAGPASAHMPISILVAYTRRAASHHTNIRADLIALAVEQTNQSFRASGIDNVTVELAHAVEVDYDEAEANHYNHLWRMVDWGDGYLENIRKLRDESGADVVVLIVDSPTGCGLATRVAADAEEAFAVVHHGCAVATFSFAHEIGHLIGARHDRTLDQADTPFPFGHGYVNGTKWRTMMSYDKACNGCPRLPIWSSPNIEIAGEMAGTADQYNARVISEQAARVAGFR